MSKEALKNIIDLVPDEDIETLYRVVIKFIPEDKPEPDELEVIAEARADHDDLISHNDINWDWWIRRLKRQPSFLRLQTGYKLVYHMVTEKRVE